MSFRDKRKARKLALQALYEWLMSGNELIKIESQFREDFDFSKVDAEYFHKLLFGVASCANELDAVMTPFLDRSIASLGPVELTALRLGAYELQYHLEVPYRVVLDEAINLNKMFGSVEGYKYVNGVLHHIARIHRASEF